MEEKIIAALNRIADAIHANAEATRILAMATAGEFDEPEDMGRPSGSLSDP